MSLPVKSSRACTFHLRKKCTVPWWCHPNNSFSRPSCLMAIFIKLTKARQSRPSLHFLYQTRLSPWWHLLITQRVVSIWQEGREISHHGACLMVLRKLHKGVGCWSHQQVKTDTQLGALLLHLLKTWSQAQSHQRPGKMNGGSGISLHVSIYSEWGRGGLV